MIVSAAIALIFVVLSLGFLIKTYNGIVAQYLVVDQAWVNIDITLIQRFNEIPQLIEICQHFLAYENNMFEKIIQARAVYLAQNSISTKISEGKKIEHGLNQILATAENYPDLKSSKQFAFILKRLSDLESVLAGRREFLNSAITNYNIAISQFPEMIIAAVFGYRMLPMFNVDPEQTQMPNLKMV